MYLIKKEEKRAALSKEALWARLTGRVMTERECEECRHTARESRMIAALARLYPHAS